MLTAPPPFNPPPPRTTSRPQCKARIKATAKKTSDKSMIMPMAKELVNTRKEKKRLHMAVAQIGSCARTLKGQVATLEVARAVGASSEVMKAMNNLIKVPELQKVLKTMSQEMYVCSPARACVPPRQRPRPPLSPPCPLPQPSVCVLPCAVAPRAQPYTFFRRMFAVALSRNAIQGNAMGGTHTDAHTHACTHARMHTRTHAHTHACTRTLLLLLGRLRRPSWRV